MAAVLDALPTSHAAAKRRSVRHEERPCPECGTLFAPIEVNQFFCCTTHRRAWNNRWTVRGAKIAPLLAVARLTRNGTRGADLDGKVYGARAGRDADVLLRRYRAEDAAANDGRGRMSLPEYTRRRYLAGFDPT